MTEVSSASAGTATQRSSRLRLWGGLAAGLLAFAVLCGLGAWQVERLSWKEGLIAQIEARRHSPPQPLAELEHRFADTGDVDYWPVRVSGRFLHEDARYFLSTRDGDAGWNVYTPLALADGRLLFVNRGFVPYDLKDPAKRQERATGTVEITGLARNALPAKPSGLPDNDPRQNVFFWRSLSDMATGVSASAGMLPFLVDAGPSRPEDLYPLGGATIVDLPNNHLQYAVTWFGLAAVLAAMLGRFLWIAVRGTPPTASGPTRPEA